MSVMELFKLDGKIAVITGGAKGLGFDMAIALAEAGADIVITSRKLENAESSVKKIINQTGKKAMAVELDVRKENQVKNMASSTLSKYGHIDILINNAGNVTSTPDTAPFEKRSLELWQEVIDINLTGVFLCSKYVVDMAMKPVKSGNIINIGSTTGIVGKDRRVYEGTNMGGATLDYHAAKGGIISMTRDMAVYLAPENIRVNCISPAGFWRDQDPKFVEAYNRTIPMGRMGIEGKEIKGAAVYLASEASSFVTGHNLVIDGGMTIW